MGKYVRQDPVDFRIFHGARASGVSFLLANGKSGDIIDPAALRTFYTRLFYAETISTQNTRKTPKT